MPEAAIAGCRSSYRGARSSTDTPYTAFRRTLSMLVHPQFDPIAIHLGPLAVRWYGLMYLLGFALFILLGRLRIKRNPSGAFTNAMLDDMLFYGVLGVILGGRLGHILFYQFGYYLQHPLEIFAVWQGGMSFHGGFIGVFLAIRS